MNNKLPTAKKTKKKFYNKYIYKVSLTMPGVSGFRYYDLPQFLEVCQSNKLTTLAHGSWRDKIINNMVMHKELWVEFISFLNNFDKNTFSKRLESDTIDFYTNDQNFYQSICENFGQYVRLRFQPPPGLENTMLDEEKKIFVKQLPHQKYQYRAYLHPHKIPHDDKQTLVQWLDKQRPSITFTPSVKKWLMNTSENWDRRYIYIDNEQTLLMMKLRSPNLVGQVFKYEIIR